MAQRIVKWQIMQFAYFFCVAGFADDNDPYIACKKNELASLQEYKKTYQSKAIQEIDRLQSMLGEMEHANAKLNISDPYPKDQLKSVQAEIQNKEGRLKEQLRIIDEKERILMGEIENYDGKAADRIRAGNTSFPEICDLVRFKDINTVKSLLGTPDRSKKISVDQRYRKTHLAVIYFNKVFNTIAEKQENLILFFEVDGEKIGSCVGASLESDEVITYFDR